IGVVAGIQLMLTWQSERQGALGLVGSYQEAYLFGGAVALVAVVFALFVRSAERQTVPARQPFGAVAAPPSFPAEGPEGISASNLGRYPADRRIHNYHGIGRRMQLCLHGVGLSVWRRSRE